MLLTKRLVSAHMIRRVLALLANRQALVSARLNQALHGRHVAPSPAPWDHFLMSARDVIRQALRLLISRDSRLLGPVACLTFVQRRSIKGSAVALISGAGAGTMMMLGKAVIADSEMALLAVIGRRA